MNWTENQNEKSPKLRNKSDFHKEKRGQRSPYVTIGIRLEPMHINIDTFFKNA